MGVLIVGDGDKLLVAFPYDPLAVESHPPPRPAAGRHESAYHDLVAGLPQDVLKKVYRLIATECHPDRGGSTEVMQRVNAAWDKIRDLF